MASSQDFVNFIVEQIRSPHPVSCRKMFGEYAVYCGLKTVALVCDDRVFVKPTPEGRAFAGDGFESGEIEEAPPYPGAKNWFVIEGRFEDGDWFSELIGITFDALPEPKPKKKKSR